MFRKKGFQINLSLVCIPAVVLSSYRTLDKLIKLSKLGFPDGKENNNNSLLYNTSWSCHVGIKVK